MTDTGREAGSPHRIPVIGIVGGIGSGKSAVANWVAERANVLVINADQIGHEALQAPDVKDELCQRFGSAILGSDSQIDRSKLAKYVFGSDTEHLAARHDLERIIHPEIGRRISTRIQAAETEKKQAVLLDAAVMLEAGWRSNCNLVVFIDTPDALRLNRVREQRSWTEEELKRRESSQWSLMDKRRESDLIVANDGQIEQAGQQLLYALEQRGVIANPISPGS